MEINEPLLSSSSSLTPEPALAATCHKEGLQRTEFRSALLTYRSLLTIYELFFKKKIPSVTIFNTTVLTRTLIAGLKIPNHNSPGKFN